MVDLSRPFPRTARSHSSSRFVEIPLPLNSLPPGGPLFSGPVGGNKRTSGGGEMIGLEDSGGHSNWLQMYGQSNLAFSFDEVSSNKFTIITRPYIFI